MKRCSRCGQDKDDACFYPNKMLKSRLRSACKTCERGDERNRLRDASNNKKWFQRNKSRRRDYDIRRKYGVTSEQVEFTFCSQARCCAICGADEPGGRYNVWQIDHNHITKKFRGVVCYRCNQLLGYACDSIEILLDAASYLRGEKNVIPE